MKQIIKPQLFWSIPCALLLSACGGGGGGSSDSDSTPSGSTITASVTKGPVHGADCGLYSITEAGASGTLLSSAESVSGMVSFSLLEDAGNWLIQCTGGTYTDESTGLTKTATQLRAVVETQGNSTIAITPLTELAVATASNLNNVNNGMIAEAFGLSTTDITKVIPTDLNTQAAEANAAGDYGQVLALLSQYLADQDLTLPELIETFTASLDDGEFSESEKTALSEAATNLASSAVATSLNTERLNSLITIFDEVVDDTPPAVTFSPSSLALSVNESGQTSLTVEGGELDNVTCDSEAVSYNAGTVSVSQAGSFTCTATAFNENQLQGQATLTLSVSEADTTPVVTFTPSSLALSVNESGQTSLTVEGGELDNVTCDSEAVSYNAGTVSVSQAGNFTCTATAFNENQLQGQATLTLSIAQANTAPVANAGDDSNVPTGSLITLDASASSDAENDTLSFSWTLNTKPNGSSASLSNANSSTSSFVTDVDGSYQITLNVSDGTNTTNDSVTVTAITNNWLLNTTTSGAYIEALVNVQSVTDVSVGPNNFNRIATSGIPDYEVLLTQADVDSLNARPKAGSDFVGGMTSAQVGDLLSFGEDIGYNIIHQGCELGYWPPGPVCPTDQQREANIPAEPAPASSECETSVNTMGLMLNGTSIYNWSDGVSYENQGVWDQLAPEFEIYDVDICSGHAQQQGDYHHHMFSSCLASLFSDEGQAHSPIYGYAADGYPIYGPYHAKDSLAKPSWVKRNYSEVNEGGCGDGTRSCLLVDPYDLSKGIVTTNNPGPDTDEIVSSNSGNTFTVASGYYFQDYYYDASLTALGGAYLDEHNGHSHDGFGYHYHSTVEKDNEGRLIPVFPYNIGPSFYGETPGGSIFTCQARP